MQFNTAPNSKGSYGYTEGLAIDKSGNVFVAVESGNTGNEFANVQKFDNQGNLLNTIGSLGFGNGQFYEAFGIALDNNNNLFVADIFGNRVVKYDSQGNFLTNIGGSNAIGGGLYHPVDIAVDGNGNVYVDDQSNNRVSVYTAAVPEPGSVALLVGMATAGIGVLRRRRK